LFLPAFVKQATGSNTVNWISNDNLASVAFVLRWHKNGVQHEDRLYAHRVNFWRDLLPDALRRDMLGAQAGARVQCRFRPGEQIPAFDPRLVHRVARRHIDGRLADGTLYAPRYGRFYPRGILSGIAGIFPGNATPFRCRDADAEGIAADFNHPLGGLEVEIEAEIREVRPKFEEHGGTANDWLEQLVSGPGMQARCNGQPTDFFEADAMARADESDDGRFYASPRMVQHIDAHAIQTVVDLHRRLIPAGTRVLDLMSSWTSHLPEDLPLARVTGLGMNALELEANPRLAQRVVHDLNRRPELPFADQTFEAIICTVSVEYLTQPLAVFAEAARVLTPGGVFITTFSDRWFPPKVIRLWKALHPFERMGLVREYFSHSGRFHDLATFSSQGWLRPAGDKYADQLPFADPVFAVWGRRA
jgi:hypothetical protein